MTYFQMSVILHFDFNEIGGKGKLQISKFDNPSQRASTRTIPSDRSPDWRLDHTLCAQRPLFLSSSVRSHFPLTVIDSGNSGNQKTLQLDQNQN